MPPIQSPFVSLALGRLRRAVTVCCWIVALALLTQTLVWCFATFTQVRYGGIAEATSKPAPIVISSATRRAQEAPTPQAISVEEAAAVAAAEQSPALRTPGANDRILSTAHATAQAAGMFAIVILIPLLALGVILGAGSSTVGVEQSVSAFIWLMVISILVLPIGAFMALPWTEGALTTYAMMTKQVEAQSAGSAAAWGGVTFYARFALLPIACVAGIAMTGLRFATGVSAGIVPKESMKLDPVLEKEAANIKASSLHGGRAGGALRAVGVGAQPHAAANGTTERKPAMAGAIGQISAGEAPRRLI